MYRLVLLLLIATSSIHSLANHPPKDWEIIIFSGGNKYKGILKKVTDSSVVLYVSKDLTDEIAFRDIDKIKLRPHSNEPGQRLLGFFIGGISGGIITGAILSAGREGEPRAIAGVVGGIGGGIIFGIVGALLAPTIGKMISTRKIVMHHTPEFYNSLQQKLQRYCQ